MISIFIVLLGLMFYSFINRIRISTITVLDSRYLRPGMTINIAGIKESFIVNEIQSKTRFTVRRCKTKQNKEFIELVFILAMMVSFLIWLYYHTYSEVVIALSLFWVWLFGMCIKTYLARPK